MIKNQNPVLTEWGWKPFFQNQITSEHPLQARITREERDHLILILPDGTFATGLLRGKWKKRFDDFENPSVGDWVLLGEKIAQSGPRPSYLIEKKLDRYSQILRKAAGESQKNQLLASNVDVAFIVTSWDHDFESRRIERYLSIIDDSKIQIVLVVNKSDLHHDPLKFHEIQTRFQNLPLVLTRQDQQESMDQLLTFLGPGRTGIFLGSSGVGKSTLTNALLGEEKQKVMAIRAKDSKGRHTTTGRSLHQLPHDRGLIVDSPGLREIQLARESSHIDETFDDIIELACHCKYPGCLHQTEPHCAVKAAVTAGQMSQARLEHYQKLKQELDKQKPWMNKKK